MNEQKDKLVRVAKPFYNPWDRVVNSLRCKRELQIEDILKSAKKGQLKKFLTSHYTIYTDPSWREKLQLCKDLVDAGMLQATFQTDWDVTTPNFIEERPRITISGRDYLLRIEQSKLWRRAIGWTAAFILGLLSTSVIKFIGLLIDLFAKKHGLK